MACHQGFAPIPQRKDEEAWQGVLSPLPCQAYCERAARLPGLPLEASVVRDRAGLVDQVEPSTHAHQVAENL